ncbi:hypothetical protein ACGFIV_31440 [Sphaerisporangium sp. NPDC049003]|uniref:hypothetical protein n=1 Tax=Sphaerisporangium sp. NPDC049003 TaxID=3364517 RepID=UPI003711BABB
MADQSILLTSLLRQRHWQTYAVFCREYDKAAKRVAPDLKNTRPSRAQLHRWLTGELKSLPYADHCRVLEAMFPGHTAEALFSPAPNGTAGHGHETPPLPAPRISEALPAVVPPIGLRPHLERAFEQDHVSIDFAGFSGETLQGVLQEPLDKIRYRQLSPKSLAIRLLLPDTTKPMTLPCKADDLTDDPDFRARATTITRRHATAILDSVNELATRGAIEKATTQIRVHQAAPLFKLYIINDHDAFFGFYPIQRYELQIGDETHGIYDLMGKDAAIFHHSADNDTGREYVKQSRLWFESMWNTVSREFKG